MVLASYGACLVTRTASAYAFAARKRSMAASDMVRQLGNAMEMLFDTAGGPQGQGGGGGGGAAGAGANAVVQPAGAG